MDKNKLKMNPDFYVDYWRKKIDSINDVTKTLCEQWIDRYTCEGVPAYRTIKSLLIDAFYAGFQSSVKLQRKLNEANLQEQQSGHEQA